MSVFQEYTTLTKEKLNENNLISFSFGNINYIYFNYGNSLNEISVLFYHIIDLLSSDFILYRYKDSQIDGRYLKYYTYNPSPSKDSYIQIIIGLNSFL